MAKNRYVNTRFWEDPYIARLSPSEKLVFLYLLTSPLANISGVFEMPIRRAVFDTGLSMQDFSAALERFEADSKIIRYGEWVGIVNFVKHQKPNPKVRIGIAMELRKVPSQILERLPATVAIARIPYGSPSIGFDSLSHPNSHLHPNRNLNSKRRSSTALSTGFSTGEADDEGNDEPQGRLGAHGW